MRSQSTSRHGNGIIEVERSMLTKEPHLSGAGPAGIRRLMNKHGSPRPMEEEHMNPVFSCGGVGDGSPSDLAKVRDGPAGENQQQQHHQERQQQPSQPQPAQHKKQVRRRPHTSRPHKERLLNMAEARREIVAALRSHRAAMKGAGDQEQQQKGLQRQEPPPVEGAPNDMIRPTKNLSSDPSNATSYSLFSHCNDTSLSFPHFSWANNPSSLVPFPENLSLIFPGKPLGLNLNYHDFNNMHITLQGEKSNPPIHDQSSSCSSYYASSNSCTTTTSTSETASGALHPAADNKEMGGIRSVGDHEGMERNGKLNSSTSQWWCKFLETNYETSPQVPDAGNGGGGTVGDVLHMFDEALGIPAWLDDQQQLEDYSYSEDCLQQDAVLPCQPCGTLDIGEIEEMDCEWLS